MSCKRFLLVLVVASLIWGQDERMSPAMRTLLQRSVSVRLSTDKSTYSAKEQPLLTMEVVNVGAQPLYMYPTARIGYDGDGVFRIYVRPEGQCTMFVWGEHVDEHPADPKASLAAHIEKNWSLVQPNDSIVLKEHLDTSRTSLCPGENTLRINYFTKLQAWTPEQVRAAEIELKYPAVFGSYDGNAVAITIVPEDKPR